MESGVKTQGSRVTRKGRKGVARFYTRQLRGGNACLFCVTALGAYLRRPQNRTGTNFLHWKMNCLVGRLVRRVGIEPSTARSYTNETERRMHSPTKHKYNV